MYRLLFLPLVANLLIIAIGASFAGDEQKPNKAAPELARLIQGSADDFIKHFDKNGDGYLTKDELPPRLAEQFDKLDTNGDGKLDKAEVSAMLKLLRERMALAAKAAGKKKDAVNQKQVDRLVDQWLERMDTNKDGKISKEEAKGPLANNFERIDQNMDGFLDKSELRRVAQQVLANQAANAGKAGKNKQGKGAFQPPQQRNFTDFDALDRNADGRLTREELKGTPYEDKFDQIDTNKDGKIDKKEFEAYLQKQEEKNKD